MKIKLICVGKTNFNFLKTGEEEYSKRLAHYCSFSRIDIPELKQVKSFTQEEIKLREGELILSKIQSGEYVVLLDDKGKSFNSIAFANHLEKKALHGSSAITFIIGGAYGFSNTEIQKIKRLYDYAIFEDDFKLEQNRKDFIIFVDELDRRRETNFLETFPQLKEFYDTYKKI